MFGKKKLVPDDLNYQGLKVKHVRTKVIKTILVLTGIQTPSGEAMLNNYSTTKHLLYDTFLLNNQFYKLCY